MYKSFEIMLITANYYPKMPKAVLADPTKLYPVKAMQITALWLKTSNKLAACLKIHFTHWIQINAGIFLVYFLLLSKTEHIILVRLTKSAAKVKEPIEYFIIHFHDLDKGNFSLTS